MSIAFDEPSPRGLGRGRPVVRFRPVANGWGRATGDARFAAFRVANTQWQDGEYDWSLTHQFLLD